MTGADYTHREQEKEEEKGIAIVAMKDEKTKMIAQEDHTEARQRASDTSAEGSCQKGERI